MKEVLSHIQSGGLANAFRDDYNNGFKWFYEQRGQNAGHGVEKVGKELRAMSP